MIWIVNKCKIKYTRDLEHMDNDLDDYEEDSKKTDHHT